MKVCIENIGVVKKAKIIVDGLTVIAGYNDSGKSTVGKILYGLYHGINVYEQNIDKDSLDYVMHRLFKPLSTHDSLILEQMVNTFMMSTKNVDQPEKKHRVADFIVKIKEFLLSIEKGYPALDTNYIVNTLAERLEFLERTDIRNNVIEQSCQREFDKKINNVFINDVGTLEIESNNKCSHIEFQHNELTKFIDWSWQDMSFTDVSFIDTPMILSDDFEQRYLNQRGKRVLGHQNDLIGKLLQPNEREENIVESTFLQNRLKKLDNNFQDVLKGSIVQENGKLLYKTAGQSFGVASLASGLKSYVIIRHLLENGYLGEKSLLIIDEPEVHLHPQWQLHFAELLVRMSKELHIRMILTTHSPYFLQALEIFSRKYKMQATTHFYLAKRELDGAIIDNIDDNVDAAYNLLAQPIMTLRELFEEQQENADDD